MSKGLGKSQVAVFAFGTRGDVLPLAVVSAALAQANKNLAITFITHEAHQNLQSHLALSGVSLISVSTPPVVPSHHVNDRSSSEPETAHSWEASDCYKATLEHRVREECIAAMDKVMGVSADGNKDFVVINFFALEGWHLAELFRLQCVVMAPYVVPYSTPSTFERRFRAMHPLLYRRLQEAIPGEVGWREVMHWMWPLFTDRWASWRTHRLHLSACPFTDPVTELPNLHDWPRASPLLYGFSQEVVECPAYWPKSVHVCGFWYAPIEWEHYDSETEMASIAGENMEENDRYIRQREVSLGQNNAGISFCGELTETATKSPAKICPKLITGSEVSLELRGRCPVDRPTKKKFPDEELQGSTATLERQTFQSHFEMSPNCKGESREKSREKPRVSIQTEVGVPRHEGCPYVPPTKLQDFLSGATDDEKTEDHITRPMFIGLSSMGSMGFMENPASMLKVLGGVLEATSNRAILLTAAHPPLDLAITKASESNHPDSSPPNLHSQGISNQLQVGCYLFERRLFCFSGPVPYLWLLPQCSMAIHHGGSGTTAACLRSGIPQIICPFVLDQYYWAERMAWLGVAPQPLKPQDLLLSTMGCQNEDIAEAVQVVAAAITRASSVEMQTSASSLREKIRVETGTSTAVQILQEFSRLQM